MEQESNHCDGRQCWLHQHRINTSTTVCLNFSCPHLQFFLQTVCRQQRWL